jgi:acyl carrier protein phosphodiesterase
MNWIAHLYLSEPNRQFRVGNLLPDLASARQLAVLGEPFQRGIRCHREIDRFTDSHPRFRSCVSRFPAPFRRYGGILTDVYFDHFLARDWSRYYSRSLPEFLIEAYRDIESCLPEIPFQAACALSRMLEEGWLGSYHQISGISGILKRISCRLQRPFDLSASVPIFVEQESAFSEDFRAFFPELVDHLRLPQELRLVQARFET